MSKTQVGIYRLFKLGRLDGSKFDKSVKRLEADLHPVHHNYANQVNENSEKNGLFYELDETATDKYWNGQPYKADTAKAGKATTDLGTGTSDGGKGKNADETKAGKAGKEGKAGKDDTAKAGKAADGKDPDLDLIGDAKKEKMAELRAKYLEVTKEEAIPTWGIKKLKEQIAF